MRNLLEDGDVERQPGPSAGLNGKEHVTLDIGCVNAAGAKGTWSALRLAHRTGLDVLLLQELGFKTEDVKPFETSSSLDMNLMAEVIRESAFLSKSICVLPPMKLGTAVMRRLLQCQLREASCFLSMTPIRGRGVLKSSSCFWSALATKQMAPRGCLQVITRALLRSPVAEWLSDEGCALLALKDEEGELRATRYNGNRAIDYGFSNRPDLCSLAGEVPEVIADHLFLKFRVNTLYKEKVSLSMSLERILNSVVDDLACTQSATERCDDIPDMKSGKETRAKGGACLLRTPVAKGTKLRPWATFRERKLQELVHRLAELVRPSSMVRKVCLFSKLID